MQRATSTSVLLCVLAPLAACDPGDLLSVDLPEVITPDRIEGAAGAELLWAGAIREFSNHHSGYGGLAPFTALLTDEMVSSDAAPDGPPIDRRSIDPSNVYLRRVYEAAHRARVAIELATPDVDEFLDDDPRQAELRSLLGYVYLGFATAFCSGVPFSTTSADGEVTYASSSTTSDALARAEAAFEAARSRSFGSTDQVHLAAVGLARARLEAGDPAGAAEASSSVPTEWAYLVRHATGTGFEVDLENGVHRINNFEERASMSDGEGGNGVAYRSEPDARVPWEDTGRTGFDAQTPLFLQLVYPSRDSDVPLADGIEARLIEAEAALASDAPSEMFSILNALRVPLELGELADPGTERGRTALLFEERARWLYGRGLRVGDLRRLVRQYGWAEDEVFPTGPYPAGGVYGDDMQFPIPVSENVNPNFDGCLDRGA